MSIFNSLLLKQPCFIKFAYKIPKTEFYYFMKRVVKISKIVTAALKIKTSFKFKKRI